MLVLVPQKDHNRHPHSLFLCDNLNYIEQIDDRYAGRTVLFSFIPLFDIIGIRNINTAIPVLNLMVLWSHWLFSFPGFNVSNSLTLSLATVTAFKVFNSGVKTHLSKICVRINSQIVLNSALPLCSFTLV